MTLLVRDVMTIGVPICRDTATCVEAAARLAPALVVVALDASGRACGWATRDELAKQPATCTVAEVMNEDIPTVLPEIPAEAAALLMRDRGLAYAFLMHSWPGEARPSAYVSRETIEQRLLEDAHAGSG
jgi:CBS domain-containing protein